MISDVLGKSGRAILDALVAGETQPDKLVALCSSRLKASRKVLIEALRGRVTDHHRFLLKLHLTQVDLLQQGCAIWRRAWAMPSSRFDETSRT